MLLVLFIIFSNYNYEFYYTLKLLLDLLIIFLNYYIRFAHCIFKLLLVFNYFKIIISFICYILKLLLVVVLHLLFCAYPGGPKNGRTIGAVC